MDAWRLVCMQIYPFLELSKTPTNTSCSFLLTNCRASLVDSFHIVLFCSEQNQTCSNRHFSIHLAVSTCFRVLLFSCSFVLLWNQSDCVPSPRSRTQYVHQWCNVYMHWFVCVCIRTCIGMCVLVCSCVWMHVFERSNNYSWLYMCTILDREAIESS